MFEYYISESPVDFFGRLTTDRAEAIAALKAGQLVDVALLTNRNYADLDPEMGLVFDSILGL